MDPFGYSFAVDLARERRKEARNKEVEAEVTREERFVEETEAHHRQTLHGLHISTLGTDSSLLPMPQTVTTLIPITQAAVRSAALSKWQRFKETFRPSHRKKRIAEKGAALAISQVEESLNQSSLPGSDLLELKELLEVPAPSASIGEDLTLKEKISATTALSPLPGYQASADPLAPREQATHSLVQAQEEADQSLEDSLKAWENVRGKRSSARVSLPTEWVASSGLSRATSVGGSEQQMSPTYTVFPRIPDTPVRDGRPQMTRNGIEELIDEVDRIVTGDDQPWWREE